MTFLHTTTRASRHGRLPSLLLLLIVTSALVLPPALLAQTVNRGPYLQMGTPTSMVLRWRTTTATNSRVRYGTDRTNLTGTANNATVTTEHEVTVTGLAANTRYYYAIGSTTQTLAGGDANHFFVTAPPIGTALPMHFWVLGDSGTANANARAVRNAYLNANGMQYTHLLLMLGDNAYNDGTDAEYQAAVFNMYPTVLRQTPLWPTLGNHDGRSADSATQTGVYYNIFTLPRQGEAGGLASGTEAYYAFDYGNIHFVVLDSFETSRAANGAMLTWLHNDLAATNQEWIIAFWHHPPYTKGSHDSDGEADLRDMRQNALPILEAAGVDLVLTGHSHSYERSFLIDGHYGASSTFNASMLVDGGDGRADGDGEYQKPAGGPAANAGAVYVVAGSSGQTGGGSLNHPVMFVSLNTLGSLVMDVNGPALDMKFLDARGVVLDYFSLIKSATPLPTVTIAATDATATEAGTTTGIFTVNRTGSTTAALTVHYNVGGTATAGSDYTTLPGTVMLPAGAASATITVTPMNDTTVEANETVVATLAANAAYRTGTQNSATITITSDDAALTVSIAATDATATKDGPTTGTMTISRTGVTTSALTVPYTVGGTATPGSDYTTLAGSLTLPVGAASAPLTITPINDTAVENNETVVVTLTANAAYTVGTPPSAIVTISSDDGVSPGTTVSLAGTSIFDNKTGKTYRPGGPDGVDPLNDLNSQAEEYKVELEAGTTFWWEAAYADPAASTSLPSRVLVTIVYRSEANWTGTLTVQYRDNSTLLATANLPVNSQQDPVTGKGQKGTYPWDVSSVVTTTSALPNGQVRFTNQSTNGKKVWIIYAVITFQ